MSLQVWLPLNGNLNNQGLSDITFSYINNNGKLSVNNSGKIGKCYERTASDYNDLIRSNSKIDLSEDITMMCWAYVSSTIGDTANGLITNHSHADNTGVGITVKQVSTSDYRISCNTGIGSDRTYCTYYGTTNIKDSWHHLSLTYSKSKKQLRLWVDGNVEYTLNNYINVSQSDYIDLFNWSTTYYTRGDFRPVCKLNDVRVYDHCLSAKEVKEISKGLVCHYKLSGVGGRNIYKDMSNFWLSGSDFPANSTRTLGKIEVTSNDRFNVYNWAHSYMTPSATSIIQTTKTYTLSVDIRTTNLTSSMTVKLSNDFRRSDHSYLIESVTLLDPQYDGVWHRYSVTLVATNQGQTNNLIGFGGSNAKGLIIEYKNFKLEEGSRATPWCPNPSDALYSTLGFDDGIEYDCSGNGNNGTKVGDIAWSGDTARYSGSYKFDGASYIITPPDGKIVNILNSNTHTISAWININELSSDYQAYFVCRTPSGSYTDCKVFLGIKSSNIVNGYYSDDREIPYSLEINKWYHIVFASNNKVVTCYVNGVKITTITKGDLNISSTAIPTIGADSDRKSCYFNGMISDVRIYSTCLSDEDIKSLYNVSASIDKTGVLSAYEFIEEGC